MDHSKLWKILQETGISDHLTCLLRNLYAGQEGTLRTRHGTMDWFQIGKGVCQGCTLSSCLFNLYAEKAMATHITTLAWKIPWTEESGRLRSMRSLSPTRLSNFTFTFHFHALEKEMATHFNVLAWRIAGTREPGRLPSMGSQRVRHD